MNIRILVKKNELLYFTAYIIWTAWYVLVQSSLYGNTMFNGLSRKLILGLCAVIFLYKIIYCDKYKVKELDIVAIVGVVTLISVFVSGNTMLALIFLLIIASKNIPFKKIVKVSLIEISLLTLFIVFSSKSGIIENYIFYRADGLARNSFGFNYTTFLGNYYLNIVLMYLYIRNNKIKYFDYMLILIINFYIYKQTDYRTGYLLIYFSIILDFMITKTNISKKINLVLNPILSYCIPFCAIISIGMSLLYDKSKSYFIFLNKVLSTRLELGKHAYLNYGLHLFGQKIDMIGNTQVFNSSASTLDYNYVDCSYLQIALVYGIAILIIICVAYTFLCINEIKKHNILLCICILIIALHSVMDPQLIWSPYNVFLLALNELFSKTDNVSNSNRLLLVSV